MKFLIILTLFNYGFAYLMSSSISLSKFSNEPANNFIDKSKEVYNNVYNIMNSEKKFCFISTISVEKNIKGYPFGSVAGYTLNGYGMPSFALSDLSRHSKNIKENDCVSVVFIEKNINSLDQKRLIITGNLKKIQNTYSDEGYKIPSRETILYKEMYLRSHPNSVWVDFPDINMYVLSKIKDVYYVGGYAKAQQIHVKKFIDLMNNKYPSNAD